jgi:hypothetical protein
MDKFDQMMKLLATRNAPERAGKDFETNGLTPFGEVIAVDRKFDLFNRAWCVAEIAEAEKNDMKHFLYVASEENIRENLGKIESFDVNECSATRWEDKKCILESIKQQAGGIEAFNQNMRRLGGGLAFEWLNKQYIDKKRENTELNTKVTKVET